MPKLTLLRHAKSSWAIPRLNDFDRPLKKRGYLDTFTMAERYCSMNLPKPDLVLASPAQRAMSTATLFCEGIGFDRKNIQPAPELYQATTVALYELLANLKHDHTLIVGHNPSLTYLAIELCQLHTTNVPTAGLVHMELAIESWPQLKAGTGRLILFDYPKPC